LKNKDSNDSRTPLALTGLRWTIDYVLLPLAALTVICALAHAAVKIGEVLTWRW